MTVLSATPMWSRSTSGTESRDGKTVTKTFRSVYQVEHTADTPDDEIEDGCGVLVRDAYSVNYPSVFCTSRAISQRGLTLSYVDVQYSGEVNLGGEEPENQSPDIEYRPLKQEAEIDEDAYGIPICTTAGEPVKGVRKTIADKVLRVTRNYVAFNGTLALQYMDSVNSDYFVVLGDTWAPGQAALTDYSVKPVFGNDGETVSYFKVTAEVTLRLPYRTIPARAWWARYRNEGMYARFSTKVKFSGGGGSGAAGYALASGGGSVTAIVVTSRGQNYTSPPSVTITSEDGGSGATATATVGTGDFEGQVVSVSVGSGGTGYKSGVQRIVDANKEPVTKPVLLAADGTRLENTDEAFWIERPVKQYRLSYTALGLLS